LNRSLLYAFVAAFILAGCGSGGSTSAPSGGNTPRVASLVVSPSNASFSESSGQQASVSVSGATGTVSFTVADASMARVSSSGASVFTVTPIAGGATAVTFSDSSGAVGTFSLSTFVCEPPSPTLDWVYPAYGSSSISSSTANIWFGLYDSTNPINSTIPDYYAYLIGSDGSTIQGQALVNASSTPPPGATPPSPSYTYTYYTSTITGLKSGVTYKMQLVDSKEQCLPPHVYGTFST
jgi:hypothetical protein